MTTTETPRTDACPHCGSETKTDGIGYWLACGGTDDDGIRSPLCIEREARQKAEADFSKALDACSEYRKQLDEAKADLIRTEIEMQLEIDKAEAEVERLKTTLQEIQRLSGIQSKYLSRLRIL